MQARIIEIFQSIQGEGLWIGKPQVFVRFHGCKLKCTYCDTPLTHHKIKQSRIEFPPHSNQFSQKELIWTSDQLNSELSKFKIKSVAITGGEPLEQGCFLESWLKGSHDVQDVLLETSGIEVDEYLKIRNQVDMVSLDLKIPSATGERAYWAEHDQFLNAVGERGHYAKVVYDENLTHDEIHELKVLLKKYRKTHFIFQPVSPIRKRDMKTCLEKVYALSEEFPHQVRLISQMHKLLSVM